MDLDDAAEGLQAPWAAAPFFAAQRQASRHALGIGALAWDHTQQSWVRCCCMSSGSLRAKLLTSVDSIDHDMQVRMPHPVDEMLQRLEFHRLPDFGPPPTVLKPLPAQHYAEFPRYAALQRLEVSPDSK